MRTPQPRRSVHAVVLAVVLAVVGGILMPLAPVTPAAPAQADVATSGTGAHRGLIDWLTWGNHGTEIVNDRASVSTRTIGNSTLRTTCTVTQRSGRIFAYRTGEWGGDALDNLYNVGGADGNNRLVYGISNRALSQGSDGTVSFQVGCQARLDGVAVPIRGLVIADAEQNNNADGQTESISARPSTGTAATWRIIDRARGCTNTSTLAILATDNALTLRSDGRQCAAAPGGPIAVAYMEGASSGTFSLTTQGGAASAIAIGTVLEGDFGDAPEGYGSAGAIFTGAWSGGALTRGTTTNVSVSSFALAQHQPGAMRLGTTVDADAGHQFSAGTADDLSGIDDEDALFGYRGAGGQQISGSPTLDLAAVPGTSETITVSCVAPTATPAAVHGWIDFNRNGVFDVATESSPASSCTNGRASLTWTIPADAKPATAQDPAFLRLRIADAGTTFTPTGMTTSGEVEDHPVALGAPAVALTKTSSLPETTAGKPGELITYTVTLTNTGRTALRSPTIIDDLSAVLRGATFVGASVSVGGGAASAVQPSGNEVRWTGTVLPAGGGTVSSAVLTVQVRLTEARRGLTVLNAASGSGTSVTITDAAGPVISAPRATVENRVAVTLEVQKQWTVVGGATYVHGTQPAGLDASVAFTGPAGMPVADPTWSTRSDGYTAGSSATISETTTIAAGLDCRLVSSRAQVTGGSALPMPAVITLTAPHTTVIVTNTVDCTSRLTLTNRVDYGDASPRAWTLTGKAPDGSGVSGQTGVTGTVRPGVDYALGSTGGTPTYARQGPWQCTIAGTTEPVAVTSGVVQAPLGKHVQCAATHATARVTILKHIEAAGGGSLRPELFTLTAAPSSTPTIDGLTVVSTPGSETEIASGAKANRFDVRPGHSYVLSETSDYAYLGLRLERQVGQGNWVEVTDPAISVPAGQHHVYRFVNAPVPLLALPLTGGIGSDTYVMAGGALLLLALAFILFRSRRSAQGEAGLAKRPATKTPFINLLLARIQKGTAAMATIKKSRAARIAAGVGAAAIATVTILGGALPASAAPNIDTNRQGSIVIHKYEQPATTLPTSTGSPLSATDLAGQEPINGVLFQIRQIGSFDVRDNADWAGLPAMSASDIVANPGNYSLGEARQLTTVTHPTLGEGVAQFGSLPLGAYIVQELAVPTVANGSSNVVIPGAPFIVAVPQAENNAWQYDVHVYPKNSVIGASKEVSSYAPQGLGSKLNWAIRSSAPIASQNTSLDSFKIEDALDSTLDYVEGSAVITVAGAALTAGTDYVVTSAATAGGTVTITFEGPGIAALRANPGAAVVATIDTIVVALSSNGEVANSARVIVNGNGVVTSNQVVEYWGGIEILKTDATTTATPLEGAVFSVYTAADTDFANPLAINGVTEFTSTANGIVAIHGLRTNVDGSAQYVVREVRAPSGFQIGNTSSWTIRVPVGTNAEVERTVTNAQVPAYALPITGGSGQAAFMIGGAGLILGGLGFVLLRRRKTQAANQA